MIKKAWGMIKSSAPGAVGAAAFDLYASAPLAKKTGLDRMLQPVVKVGIATAAALVADKFAPASIKKHAGTFLTGSLAISARDMIARATGHAQGKLDDLASQYEELVSNDMQELVAENQGLGDYLVDFSDVEDENVAELVEAGY